MRIVDSAGLPEPIFRAVLNDPYTPGDADVSVTGLLKPSRQWALERQHWEEVELEAADRLYALMGQCGHALLERAAGRDPEALISSLAAIAASEDSVLDRIDAVESLLARWYADAAFSEFRLFAELGGWRISGQVDYLTRERKITDYKFCSVYVAKEGAKPEWIAQQNLYRWLCRRHDIDVSGGAQIVAIFRDWSKRKARHGEHPRTQAQVFELPLWSNEETERYALERMKSHREALLLLLPHCTPEERWQRPEGYAVVGQGKKRAMRVLPNLEEAEAWIQNWQAENAKAKKPKKGAAATLLLQERKSEPIRCADYCVVADFCSQYQAELAAERESGIGDPPADAEGDDLEKGAAAPEDACAGDPPADGPSDFNEN